MNINLDDESIVSQTMHDEVSSRTQDINANNYDVSQSDDFIQHQYMTSQTTLKCPTDNYEESNESSRIIPMNQKRIHKQSSFQIEYPIKKPKHPENNIFSPEEDRRLLELVREYGPKFKLIASKCPLKSIYSLKNRYYKYLRYRWVKILKWHPKMAAQQQLPSPGKNIKHHINSMGLFQENKQILLNLFQQVSSMFSQ